ncbi:MAG: hypothetical protein WA055_04735 [Candidatus Moraniibacteriota bacterium]
MKKKFKEMIDRLTKDKTLRVAVTRNSHFWFFHSYFNHYVKYPTANFQKEIIKLTEDEKIKNLFIVAFRGSSKSSLITMSYVLWSILGIQQKKCVIIASQTAQQARMHLLNIKRELEGNKMLQDDLGPFREEKSPWGMSMLVFPQYDAMIIPLSTEQSIRGNRFGQNRPDLFIGDDLEDDSSVRTKESRDKTYDWLKNEVFPAGDKDTRVIIVGNLLHEDSLLMRLRQEVENGNLRDALFKEYPIIRNGKPMWPGKFPILDDIEKERKRIGNDYSWHKEYLLDIVSREGQVIPLDWIEYYDSLPQNKDCYRGIYIGVDLAISTNKNADYNAFVVGLLCEIGNEYYIYVLPNPINKKMTFQEILDSIKILYNSMESLYDYVLVSVENNGFQDAVPQMLEAMGIENKSVRSNVDKRCRLITISNHLQAKKVLFPKQGAEQLINQLVNFGVEKHDDLADAFTIMMHEAVAKINEPKPGIFFMEDF